ncbi:PDZ domain-containing protein [Kitasatospora sp. RB6PN24]|uniref:S41 family peptidase n=1 Tax=Kitasatospora humi TaxID=2893891 RepID=UPI001E2A86B1|nr:S41 family peptidase [Kitasatospora humi]MCC9308519.1 PDZ domain-containing protein [Kitasatospora humi]
MTATPWRRVRHGAVLSALFGLLLFGGSATGAWGGTAAPLPGRPDPFDAAPGGSTLSPQQAEQLAAGGGDRWAAYYTAQQYAEFAQGLDGRYLGVGLVVSQSPDGGTVITAVPAGSPADRAGMAAGDRLLAVDGTPVDRLPVTEVVARLRGRPAAGPGSAVTLTVRRPGAAPRQLTLQRAVLASQDVEADQPAPGVLRISVHAFTAGVGGEVRDALRGTAHRGVLLDLRGNSGGLLAESVATASDFLDGGPVASYQVGDERRQLTASPGGDTRTPLVVLVDGGTMSAAELLAGALQDRCRAVLVGSRTFGKGTVQQPSRLADGSVLERTVGRYYTPAGRSPDGTGLLPDVTAPDPAAAERLALRVLGGLGTAR